MKAIVEEDIIRVIVADNSNRADAVEIGKLPRNVGLERLRWTGSKIVDIEKLDKLYVRGKPDGGFELHAIEVEDSQPVSMRYIRDRRHLFVDADGAIKIATKRQVTTQSAREVEAATLKKAMLKIKGLNREQQDEVDAVLLCFMCALVVYTVEQPPQLKALFESLAPHIKDSFPLDKWQDKLVDFAMKIKEALDDYN